MTKLNNTPPPTPPPLPPPPLPKIQPTPQQIKPIFPLTIPVECYPKVNSLVRLLDNLQHDDDVNNPAQPGNPFINDNQLNKHIFDAYNHIRNVETKCQYFQNELTLAKKAFSELKNDERPSSHPPLATSEQKQQAAIIQRKKMTQRFNIAHYNHRYCLASATCTERMRNLERCWGDLLHGVGGSQQLEALVREGVLDSRMICKKERDSVERCSGLFVERVVKGLMEQERGMR